MVKDIPATASMPDFYLVEPCLDKLPDYVAALRAGSSPNTTRDVTGEQFGKVSEDAQAFIDGLIQHEGRLVTAADGTKVPRLPGRVFWVWDGAFCGAINFRSYQERSIFRLTF